MTTTGMAWSTQLFLSTPGGTALTLSPSDIWSVAWDMACLWRTGPILTGDGVRIDNFTYDPEYMGPPR